MIATQNQLVPGPEDASDGVASGEQPGVVARTIYKTSYCLSFGIVYPALLVVGALPTKNAVGYGLTDGACAASDAQRRVQAKAVAAATSTKSRMGDAYAGVAARVSQRVESIEDAIAERRYRRRVATA